MRQMMLSVVLFLGVASALAVLATSNVPAQEAETEASDPKDDAQRLVIVPLVTIQPGQTRTLLLTTKCTVGVTRGGGFGLSEMRDGKPFGGGYDVKKYHQRGVTITVPDFNEGPKFASSPEFAALHKLGVNAFQVTISAADDAQPGLLEIHLVDSTCSGHCKTDFRVLVVEP